MIHAVRTYRWLIIEVSPGDEGAATPTDVMTGLTIPAERFRGQSTPGVCKFAQDRLRADRVAFADFFSGADFVLLAGAFFGGAVAERLLPIVDS